MLATLVGNSFRNILEEEYNTYLASPTIIYRFLRESSTGTVIRKSMHI